jgi:hypothetical protein
MHDESQDQQYTPPVPAGRNGEQTSSEEETYEDYVRAMRELRLALGRGPHTAYFQRTIDEYGFDK